MITKKEELLPLNIPHFEKIILRNLLQNQNKAYACTVIDHLQKSFFVNQELGQVFDTISRFFKKYNNLPNKSEIFTLFPKDGEKPNTVLQKVLAETNNLENSYNFDFLIDNTEIYIKQRLLHQIISEAVDEYGDKKAYDINKSAQKLREIEAINLTQNFGIDFVEYRDIFLEKLDEPENYISTGFPNLDMMMGGGFFREGKAFYCFAGETNVGKSIVLANLAWNTFVQGNNVLIVSLEMSEFRYYKRIATISSGTPTAIIQQNKKGFKDFVSNFEGKEKRLRIKEFAPKSITPKALEGFITNLQKQKSFRPDVIIVDYHGLFKAPLANVKQHESLQSIVQELRALSYRFGAPMVSVAQLNRSGSGSNDAPGLDKTAGSWDQIADMDFYSSIWQTDEDKELGILRYSIQKTRDTKSKKAKGFFNIDTDTLKLTDNLDDVDFDFEMQKDFNSMLPVAGSDNNLKMLE